MTEKKDEGYRCQFCGVTSPAKDWIKDCCPNCGKAYDPILLQDYDDE